MDAVRELIWAGSYGSTTIDQICEKAGVKKGSFYYFFDSKADLAVTAIEVSGKTGGPELDSIFPRRFLRWSESAVTASTAIVSGRNQSEIRLCARLFRSSRWVRKSAPGKIGCNKRSRKSSITSGCILKQLFATLTLPGWSTCRMFLPRRGFLFAYYQGLMTEARIQNDLKVLARGRARHFGNPGNQSSRTRRSLNDIFRHFFDPEFD